MALTTDQRDVFLLAVEVIETTGIKAMDHVAHSHVQTSVGKPGANPLVDWAVSFLGCLPNCRELSRLIVRAHSPEAAGAGAWSKTDIRRCGGACRGFYRRIHSSKPNLFGEGLRYLRMKNGERL